MQERKSKSWRRLLGYPLMVSIYAPLMIAISYLLIAMGKVTAIVGLVLATISIAVVVPHFSVTWAFNRVARGVSRSILPLLFINITLILGGAFIVHYAYSQYMPNDTIGPHIIKIAGLIGFLRAGLYGIQSYMLLQKRKG